MIYLRSWRKFNLEKVGKQLLVIGDLSAECFNCHKLGLNLESRSCPECGAVFNYIGFRRQVKAQDLKRFSQGNLKAELIDFADFKKALHKKEARNIFKDS